MQFFLGILNYARVKSALFTPFKGATESLWSTPSSHLLPPSTSVQNDEECDKRSRQLDYKFFYEKIPWSDSGSYVHTKTIYVPTSTGDESASSDSQ